VLPFMIFIAVPFVSNFALYISHDEKTNSRTTVYGMLTLLQCINYSIQYVNITSMYFFIKIRSR
jgi:hypothetical protein